MSYVVLARKWRPQRFDDLTGQEHVATTLSNAIARDRVPHALLFTGARGVGKTSSARILAMALNCVDGPTANPCGVCPSCEEVQRGQSVDVLEIDGASNRGINEIRELRDGVRYTPQRDRYKIYIIDEVHMLTTEAFNALLKTLEEPPRHVVFIFATTEAQRIPVTILSRCQRFDFRRIPHAAIVERLATIAAAEKLEIDPAVLGLVARQAAGGMRDALSLLDQIIAFAGTTVRTEDAEAILGASERRRLFALSAALIARDVEAALRVIDEVDGYGVDIAYFAVEIVSHLRDLSIVAVAAAPSDLLALTDRELAEARTQAASTDIATLHRMFEIMVDAADSIARSNHPRLLLEMALIRITTLEPAQALSSLIARLDAIAAGEPPPTTLPPAVPPSAAPVAPPAAGSPGAASAGAPATTTSVAAVPATAPHEPPAAARTPAPREIVAPPTPQAPAAAPPDSVGAALASASPSVEAPASGPTDPTGLRPPTSSEAPTTAPGSTALAAAADTSPPPAPDALTGGADAPPSELPLADETTVERVGGVRLSADSWRTIVDALRREVPHAGTLLASARTRFGDGTVDLGLAAPMLGRVDASLLDQLNDLCEQAGAGRQTFRLHDRVALDDEAVSRSISEVEDDERRSTLEAARRAVEEHPATRLLLTAFPGSELRPPRIHAELS